MSKYFTSASVILILLSSLCSGDIFKHRETGEVFHGYQTNLNQGEKNRIYVEKDGKFVGKTIIIDEYEVTYSTRGRRENLVVIGIDHQDIILSNTVSEILAKTIEEAANTGPRSIILEIDSPGGRGDCMKIICDAIRRTYNCPIIAYIKDKKYGGAFSAAAGIALACDKIYVSPDAQIGSLSAPVNETKRQQQLAQWQQTFTPDSIASFGKYISIFAQKKNRPTALARALVDRSINVLEVVTDEKGSRDFVTQDNIGTGAVEKTWSKKIPVYNLIEKDNDEKEPPEQYQITLSAKDAVSTGIADTIASSRNEVIKDLNAEGIKVLETNRIKTYVRRFAQHRSQLLKYLAGIDELQTQVEKLEKAMQEVSSAALKNSSADNRRINRLERQAYENRFFNRYSRNNRVIQGNVNDYKRNGALTREQMANIRKEMEERYLDPYVLQQQKIALELAYVLDNLLVNTSRSVAIAKKYPGALPEGKTLKELQIIFNTALTKLKSLGF